MPIKIWKWELFGAPKKPKSSLYVASCSGEDDNKGRKADHEEFESAGDELALTRNGMVVIERIATKLNIRFGRYSIRKSGGDKIVADGTINHGQIDSMRFLP